MSAFLRACTKSFVPVLCTALLSAPTAVPTAAARSASATVSVCRAANGSSLQLTLSWSGFRANWWRHQLYEYDPDTTVGVGEEELSATSSSGTLTWTLYLDSPSPTQEDLDAMDRGYGGVYYVDSKGNTTDGPYQTVERPATGWATCAEPTYQGKGSATVSVCRAANGSSLQLTLSWSGFRANWWRHQLYEYDPDTTVGVGEEELSATSSSGTLTWTLYLDSPSPTQEDLDAMDRGYGGVYYVDSKGNTTDGPYQTVERPATGWATCA